LLLIASVPLCAPAVVGANFTCSVPDWPTFSVIGKLPPTTENPVPDAVAELIVNVEVPVDFTETVCAADEFTATLPKLRLVVPSVNCGFDVAPVPLSATVAVFPLDELLATFSVPLAVPDAVGENTTETVSDCPGFNVVGKVPAIAFNVAPITETEFTVTGPVPVELNASD